MRSFLRQTLKNRFNKNKVAAEFFGISDVYISQLINHDEVTPSWSLAERMAKECSIDGYEISASDLFAIDSNAEGIPDQEKL